eukprot:gene11997-biopygen10957
MDRRICGKIGRSSRRVAGPPAKTAPPGIPGTPGGSGGAGQGPKAPGRGGKQPQQGRAPGDVYPGGSNFQEVTPGMWRGWGKSRGE